MFRAYVFNISLSNIFAQYKYKCISNLSIDFSLEFLFVLKYTNVLVNIRVMMLQNGPGR